MRPTASASAGMRRPAFARGPRPARDAQADAAPTDSPRRIISLVPATTEMLFAMGAGNRIAGVSNYDRFPPEVAKLPKVGGLLDPNVERLISLKPDLVIVYDTQTDLKQQLDRAGIPMFRYVHRGLPDITETMRALGERVGVESRGRGRGDSHRTAARGDPSARGGTAAADDAADLRPRRRARCATSTPAAATDFFTTCSNWPVARDVLGDLKTAVR